MKGSWIMDCNQNLAAATACSRTDFNPFETTRKATSLSVYSHTLRPPQTWSRVKISTRMAMASRHAMLLASKFEPLRKLPLDDDPEELNAIPRKHDTSQPCYGATNRTFISPDGWVHTRPFRLKCWRATPGAILPLFAFFFKGREGGHTQCVPLGMAQGLAPRIGSPKKCKSSLGASSVERRCTGTVRIV